MNDTKRNLLLIYPGMNPGLSLFTDYLDRDRTSELNQEQPQNAPSQESNNRFRWVSTLWRRDSRLRRAGLKSK